MKKTGKIKKDKQKEEAHIFRNTFFMLKCAFKCAPVSLVLIYLAYILENVYYSVVFNVMFLETAMSIIEGNGTWEEFATKITIIIAGKLAVDLFAYIDMYTIRTKFEIKVESYINNLIFEKAQQVELGCYEDPDFFDNYNRATWVVDKGGFKRIIEGSAWTIGSLISFIFIIVYLVKIDPFLLLLVACPAVLMIIRVLENKVAYRKEKEMTPFERQKEYIRRTVILKDFAKDIKTTDIFDVIKIRFKNAINENIKIIKKYGWKLVFIEVTGDIFGNVLPVVGGLGYGSYRLIYSQNLEISEFSVLVSAIMTSKNKLNNFARYFAMQQKHCLWVQNLRNFLNYEPKITDGALEADDFRSLEFRNVTFSYGEDKPPVLKSVSFKINRGESIAVVGHNGAGKTTLSKLIMRLYDVKDGEILYNGRNIKEYSLSSYRKKFCSVFQDYKIFALTVAENVLVKETDGENIHIAERALEMGGVADKINSLEKKANTLLTREFDNNGVLLSGGQAQKVSISKLFANDDFEVAVLDEPSSALDPVAESKMYDAIMEGTRDKTVIYISHRLSSATRSDNILVFEKGEIIERGSHSQLMEKNGAYAEMFTLQASGYKDGEESEPDYE